jgi:hypothetical protein
VLILENLVTGYVSANFTESETDWDIGTSYSYGEEAREGHYIYKSLVSGANTNTGNQPSISPLHWKKNRPSNYFAALDNVNLTQTQNADKVEFTISGVNYDAISILGIDGYSISVEMIAAGISTAVFSDTKSLDNSLAVIDEMTYWFNDFDFTTTYFSRLPIYSDSTIKVTIDKLGSTAKVGTLCAGRTLYLGDAAWGASFDMESWGRKVVDEFGATELTHTNSVYSDTYTLNIPSTKIRELQRKVKQYDFKPLIFIGDETDDSLFENLVDIGYWETVKMVLSNPIMSTVNITKKGLI